MKGIRSSLSATAMQCDCDCCRTGNRMNRRCLRSLAASDTPRPCDCLDSRDVVTWMASMIAKNRKAIFNRACPTSTQSTRRKPQASAAAFRPPFSKSGSIRSSACLVGGQVPSLAASFERISPLHYAFKILATRDQPAHFCQVNLKAVADSTRPIAPDSARPSTAQLKVTPQIYENTSLTLTYVEALLRACSSSPKTAKPQQ